jgi:hypothetical protein
MASTLPTKHSPAAAGEPTSDPRGGVTWRAALISLLIIAISAPAIFYGEVVWNRGTWSNAVPASWPLAVLFLLAAAMGLPVFRRLALSRRELLTIYCAVLVATPLLSVNVIFWALSQPISYYYFGQAFPQWETTFIRLIPTWFSPSSASAVQGYFWGRAAVPWSEWLVPLAAWSSFLSAVFLANLCLVSLVQRQWITHERLTFPLAQIPLETVESVGGARSRSVPHGSWVGRLSTSRKFWLGLVIAVVVTFGSSLSQRIPSLPAFPLLVRVMNPQPVGPMSAFGQVDMALYPWLLAIAYLIPKELSFSVWSLWLVRIGLTALAIATGAEPGSAEDWWRFGFPAPYNQATGAVLALSGLALWGARRHLARALRTALSWRQEASESAEPLRYRWAFAGFAVCFAWLVYFFLLAGCRPAFALAFSAVIIGAYLSYARLQAEAALDTGFWWFNDVMLMPVGAKRYLPQEIISLYTAGWVSAPMPSIVLSTCSINMLTSFKISDAAGVGPRRLTHLLLGGFLFALVVGIFVTLTGTYRLGFLAMKGATGNNLVADVLRIYGHDIYNDIQLNYDVEPSPEGVFYIGVGAVVCLLLGVLRLRFLWWPFHPVGYILSNSLPVAYGLFPFFMAWVAKALVIRYGGLRLYRATLPLAIGLIVGDLLNTTLWNLIALATCGRW